MVAFAVMASGITSASTLARAFAGDYPGRVRRRRGDPGRDRLPDRRRVDQPARDRGVGEAERRAHAAIEVGGLLLIVVIGIAALGDGCADSAATSSSRRGSERSFAAILGGAALAFYALIGFEDSVNVAEEIEEPSRNYPRVALRRAWRSPACSTCS